MREFFTSKIMRRMVTFLLLTEFLWGLGNFFVLPTTTLPAYLRELGAAPIIIGVLSIAMSSLVLFPQMFGRVVIERFAHRKRAVMMLHLLCASCYLLIPISHRFLVPAHRAAQVWTMIGLLAVGQLAIGLVTPVWMDMLSQVVPLPLRGRYFGMSSLFFAGGGLLGGLGIMLLQSLWKGHAYQGTFLVASAFFIISMCSFAAAPIAESALSHPAEPSLLSRLRISIAACHLRTNFGRLVASYAVQALAASVVPFLMIYVLDQRRGLGYGDTIVGLITCFLALGSAFGGLLLGSLVDRLGPRVPWAIATLLVPAMMLLIPFGRSTGILIAVFLLAGMLNALWAVSGPAMLELSPEGDKSGYIAMANLIGFIPTTVGYLLIGLLIGVWGFHIAFVAVCVAGGLAFLVGLSIRGRDIAPTSPTRRRQAIGAGRS